MIRHNCKIGHGGKQKPVPMVVTFGDFYDPPMLNCPYCDLPIPFPVVQGDVIPPIVVEPKKPDFETL